MKRNDALKKICPWMSQGEGIGITHCQAEGCMAWQRHESASFKSNAEYVFRQSGKRRISDEGYCSRGARPVGDEA